MIHQDDNIPFEELPWPVQLNVQCDRLATKKLKEIEALTPLLEFFPASSKISVQVDGTTLTHKVCL